MFFSVVLGYKYILRVLSTQDEHRPGLGRDDGDEAEHEVHLGPDLGDIQLVLADERRVDRGEDVHTIDAAPYAFHTSVLRSRHAQKEASMTRL